jgi:hypothetical protein
LAGCFTGSKGLRYVRDTNELRVKLMVTMLLRNDVFRRLVRARDMLEEVPEDPVSIEDVAREVGISPFHLRQSHPDLPASAGVIVDPANRKGRSSD